MVDKETEISVEPIKSQEHAVEQAAFYIRDNPDLEWTGRYKTVMFGLFHFIYVKKRKTEPCQCALLYTRSMHSAFQLYDLQQSESANITENHIILRNIDLFNLLETCDCVFKEMVVKKVEQAHEQLLMIVRENEAREKEALKKRQEELAIQKEIQKIEQIHKFQEQLIGQQLQPSPIKIQARVLPLKSINLDKSNTSVQQEAIASAVGQEPPKKIQFHRRNISFKQPPSQQRGNLQVRPSQTQAHSPQRAKDPIIQIPLASKQTPQGAIDIMVKDEEEKEEQPVIQEIVTLRVFGIDPRYENTPNRDRDFVSIKLQENKHSQQSVNQFYISAIAHLKRQNQHAQPFYGDKPAIKVNEKLFYLSASLTISDLRLKQGDTIILLGDPCPHINLGDTFGKKEKRDCECLAETRKQRFCYYCKRHFCLQCGMVISLLI
ncbi:hypothetical protein FGO68_gene13731 [Halteria grandinella]|uniref:Uncharacterized protein n=1 Tax=Halteria grandinella TaxID=5974 RepID=A0A8J8T623_HALGN|nr:hypothetical protein FGO68_gene13731 [Halteria grandinella]